MFYTCIQREIQAESPYSLAEGTRTPVSLNFYTLVFTLTVLIGAFDILLSCMMYVTVLLRWIMKLNALRNHIYVNLLRNHSYIYI